MVHVRLGVLLLITALLPLLCAELSRTEETSSTSGRDSVKPTSCGKDCEERARVRKGSTQLGIKGHASKMSAPVTEHSTTKKSSPGIKGHASTRSMPGTEARTTKRSTTRKKDETRKMSTLGTEHSSPKTNKPGTQQGTPKKSTPVTEHSTTKKITSETKCELYYFVPTTENTDEAFFFWNNTKAEQLKAYSKFASFLRENPHEEKPLFFPAHIPLVWQKTLVLKDVYVRAKGACGYTPGADEPGYFDTNPDWFKNPDERLQKKLEILENYVQRIPRSHFGYRVPKDGEHDVCLDDTGLVVRDFPGIRTCFSMWIYEDLTKKPKHFAGRQIYNRINQMMTFVFSNIGYDPTGGDSRAEPIRAGRSSMPALFLKEMCYVTNASLANRCTYWPMRRFYVSLCCCYTNRTECAYRKYKFPSQRKPDDPVIRACATGDYYYMKHLAGAREPQNASDITSSVREFVQEKTSSELCKWTYTWDPRKETALEAAMRVDLDAAKPITRRLRSCTSNANSACCQRTTTLCPVDPYRDINATAVECFCRDGDLCNHPRSTTVDADLAKTFRKARPCEVHTPAEHLLSLNSKHKKSNTSKTTGYMCPVFYNFAHPTRPNTFLQLVDENNVEFDATDKKLFREDGCHLVEGYITEAGRCSEKLFGEHDQSFGEVLLIMLCAVEGNPLGARRKSFPDAELKKTIEANLTAAKEAFPTCKNGSLSLDFESLSELVMDNNKLFDMYNDRENGTNDNITTVHCYVEVSFVYQQQYNLTFGAVPIENKPLLASCYDSERLNKPVRWNSGAHDEHPPFVYCCQRHWSKSLDACRQIFLEQLKPLLWEIAIAEEPEEIMSELKKHPLTKCVDWANEGQSDTDINRPCGRNEGCYTGVHARDVPSTRQHKKYGGCVSEYAPAAKKRDDATSDEAEARFSRICRIPRNQDHCFAVLGTEDAVLPDDVKGPQMVCCCKGRLESAQKCGTSRQFGMKIGDYFDFD